MSRPEDPRTYTLRIPDPRPPPACDAAAEGIAARQHGLVTRRQLLHAGISAAAVARRVRSHRLVPVFRGVYRVGPIASPRSREMAALLACGPGAVISHGSAAAVLALVGAPSPGRAVDVALRSAHRRERPGIRLHQLLSLRDEDVCPVDGLSVTTAARTLFDLASGWRLRSLERALSDAIERRLTSLEAVKAMVERHAGRPGSRRLRSLLDDGGPAFTRSELESDFLALVRAGGVEPPETNARVGSYEVDFYWRSVRLVVELDGFRYHSSRAAFERDRKRDAELATRGIRVVRVTSRQLAREREAVLVRLGGALMAGR